MTCWKAEWYKNRLNRSRPTGATGFRWTFTTKYGIFCPLCHTPFVAEARSKKLQFYENKQVIHQAH